MQKENISDRKRCHRLSSSRAKAHQNSRSQETPIASGLRSPDSTSQINRIADDIDWPSSIFIDERHPNQVSGTLHQSCGREEVSGFVDRWPESSGLLGTREEFHGGFNDCNRRAGGKEVANHHRKTDDECGIVFLLLRPMLCQRWPVSDLC